MITVTISETNSHRKWSHRARTKDALTAIIRTMNKHFPQAHNFIPDDVDNALILFAAVASTPNVKVLRILAQREHLFWRNVNAVSGFT